MEYNIAGTVLCDGPKVIIKQVRHISWHQGCCVPACVFIKQFFSITRMPALQCLVYYPKLCELVSLHGKIIMKMSGKI